MIGLEDMQAALQEVSERSKARATLTNADPGDAQGAWDAMMLGAGVDEEDLGAVTDWITEQGSPALQAMMQLAPQLAAMMSTAFAAGFVTGRSVRDHDLEEPRL